MSFAVRKYLRLLPPALFSAGVWYSVFFFQSIFAGNILGDDALAALNIIATLVAIVDFFNLLISSGASICFSLEMGRADRKRAHEFVTQGLFAVLVFSVPLALFFKFGGSLIIDFFGVTPAIGALIHEYLSWFWIYPIVEGMLLLFQGYIAAEGDTLRGWLSFAVFALVDILGSYFALKFGLGFISCAAALVIAEALALAVLVTHLFAKSNTLRFPLHFSFKDLYAIVSASFGDAAARLCTALTMFVLTKLVIVKCGANHLAVMQLAVLLWGFDELFNGFSTAMQPLVTVYHGEGNPRGVRAVMRSATLASLLVAGGMALALLIAPALAASAFGITDPALHSEATYVVRLGILLLPTIALAGIFNSYLMCIERSSLAVVISVLSYCAFPVLGALIGASVSVSALYLGFALGPLLGLLIGALVISYVRGKTSFPLLLDLTALAETASYTLKLSDEAVVKVSRKIGDLRASLLVEEALLAVRDRNQPRSVLAEVTIRGGEDPRLILRDDGEIFDITDADAKITSLRGFVVASLMEKHLNRLNLITTGFNRNVFKIKRS